MAKIVINEVSQNYVWNVGANNYATVALPITSCWGPGYFDPETAYSSETGLSDGDKIEKMLESTVWQRFPATQAGLDAFVAAYRGPASNYRNAKDFSYQIATTLLTSGYDVLVCRMCPGTYAEGSFIQLQGTDAQPSQATISFRAKYPGTFGNNLQIIINKVPYYAPSTDGRTLGETKYYWNILTYVIDSSGVRSAVESKTLVFRAGDATDTVLYYKEVESNFWDITGITGTIGEGADDADISAPVADTTLPYDSTKTYAIGDQVIHDLAVYECTTAGTTGTWDGTKWNKLNTVNWIKLGATTLTQGTDYNTTWGTKTASDFTTVSIDRFNWAAAYQLSAETYTYPTGIATAAIYNALDDDTKCSLYYREWLFTHLVGRNLKDSNGNDVGGVFDLLKDKLAYNPNRIISPGWDDQDLSMYTDNDAIINTIFPVVDGSCPVPVSPMHLKIMDVAYYSRCATGYIDSPIMVDRKYVHIEDDNNPSRQGYVQKLARVVPANAALDVNGSLFHTHCGFFAPWTQFQYVGTSRMSPASPSFAALMIQRAQILNQPTQYEWALPTNRKHGVRLGKLEYTVPKKLLDKWQKLDGASVNVITTIPDLGTNIWGNSTLFEVPPATYQALANLSTRFLVNAVEDIVYKAGISITFQYNNNQAFNKFYAAVTPLLDTMKNVGAIDGYRVEMSADIDELDHVNANTVIGKVWLLVNGVINDIYVDLIALPAGAGIDLSTLS